jgi:peptidoglycan/xylan/chitin deacetylase (PgdA/CDA1 family)
VEDRSTADNARANGRAPLIVTYHEIAFGRSPLCVSVEVLRAHLDCLAECAVTPMTISDLGRSLREGRLPRQAICLTFDDGFASVVDAAAPLLLERECPATIFAVAGYLGKQNDWPSQPAWVERRPLAGARQLSDLAEAGFEIGAHGFEHEPLGRVTAEVADREIVDGRAALEDAVGVAVTSFAYPYGSLPSRAARALVLQTYSAACTTIPDVVRRNSGLATLPRIDAHSLRGPDSLRRLLEGSGRSRLGARRLANRLRRVVRNG